MCAFTIVGVQCKKKRWQATPLWDSCITEYLLFDSVPLTFTCFALLDRKEKINLIKAELMLMSFTWGWTVLKAELNSTNSVCCHGDVCCRYSLLQSRSASEDQFQTCQQNYYWPNTSLKKPVGIMYHIEYRYIGIMSTESQKAQKYWSYNKDQYS